MAAKSIAVMVEYGISRAPVLIELARYVSVGTMTMLVRSAAARRNRCKRVVQYRASTFDGDNPLLCKRPDPQPEVVNRRVLTQQALGIGRRAARNEDRVRPPGLLDEGLQPAPAAQISRAPMTVAD